MKKLMTDAQLETWMELCEDEQYDAVIKQKKVLDLIADAPKEKVIPEIIPNDTSIISE
jgi:hypothetical protein